MTSSCPWSPTVKALTTSVGQRFQSVCFCGATGVNDTWKDKVILQMQEHNAVGGKQKGAVDL